MSKYTLAVLAIFKNESMIIKEWLEHHIWQGVEHFYLINNDSDDNYLEIIQPYLDSGLITLYHLPEKYKQNEHYNTVFNQIKTEMEWLAIIDIDEYLYTTTNNLKTYFENIPLETYAVSTYWYMFGSNGHDKQPEDIRLSFTKRDYKIIKDTSYGKAIIRPKMFSIVGQHLHRYSVISQHIIIHKKYDVGGLIIDYDTLRLNHYQIMSKEYFEKVKMSRGDVLLQDRDVSYRTWEQFNVIDKMCDIYDLTLHDLVLNKKD